MNVVLIKDTLTH